jgi:hypothetical protein
LKGWRSKGGEEWWRFHRNGFVRGKGFVGRRKEKIGNGDDVVVVVQ